MLKAFAGSRPLLWLVLALPGLWIAGRWTFTPDLYGYGHAIGDSGDWARRRPVISCLTRNAMRERLS